jgi:hypothetical protein
MELESRIVTNNHAFGPLVCVLRRGL